MAYAFAAIPARYTLERRQWGEAAKMELPQVEVSAASRRQVVIGNHPFPGRDFCWAEAHIHYARAIGAARSGDTASARTEVEQLAAIQGTR